MKALSIRQPWLDAVLRLGKRIENRQRWSNCHYRGPLLLHAASGMTKLEYESAIAWMRDVAKVPRTRLPTREELLFGGILGRARIDGVIRDEKDFAVQPYGESQRVWWMGGFALVFSDVEATGFVACKGALGLFEVPDDIVRKVTH